MNEREYAGFWIRVGASLIDTIFVSILIAPILTAIYGVNYWVGESSVHGIWELLFSYILPAIMVLVFWIYRSATPGKMITKIIIVDAETGGRPSVAQLIKRYLGYFLSIIPLCLGLIWVGIDKRKQGWHDKIAGTVVIKGSLSARPSLHRSAV